MHCFLFQDNFFFILLQCVLPPQIWYDNYVTALVTPQLYVPKGLYKQHCSSYLSLELEIPRMLKGYGWLEGIQPQKQCIFSQDQILLHSDYSSWGLGRTSKLFHFFQRQEERWSVTGARTAPFNSWGARGNECQVHLTWPSHGQGHWILEPVLS